MPLDGKHIGPLVDFRRHPSGWMPLLVRSQTTILFSVSLIVDIRKIRFFFFTIPGFGGLNVSGKTGFL